MREIARLIDVSPKYVGKELGKLLKMNLVNKHSKGNLTIYSANKNSIIFNELKQIFLPFRAPILFLTNKLSKNFCIIGITPPSIDKDELVTTVGMLEENNKNLVPLIIEKIRSVIKEELSGIKEDVRGLKEDVSDIKKELAKKPDRDEVRSIIREETEREFNTGSFKFIPSKTREQKSKKQKAS